MLFRFWTNRKAARTVTPSRPRRFRPYVELLERRELLSVTTFVTNTNDDGLGSLRAAITAVNQPGGPDRIGFSMGAGVRTIALNSPLPTIVRKVAIDGYSGVGARKNTLGNGQGPDAVLTVELTPAKGKNVPVGLAVGGTGSSSASGTVISGLALYGFSQAAINVSPSSSGGNLVTGVKVSGCFIGTDAQGNARGNGTGIDIIRSSQDSIGGPDKEDRNLISGNKGAGIRLEAGADDIAIQNNLVGTSKSGTGEAVPNGAQGVFIEGGSRDVVGGATANLRNVISGNKGNGVDVFGSTLAASGLDNVVRGNYIGTDVTGKVALGHELTRGNEGNGVVVNAATNTLVRDNVIAANGTGNAQSGGIFIGFKDTPRDAVGTAVLGNLIGVGADGAIGLGNRNFGVYLGDRAVNTTIGGTTPADRNVISRNAGDGILAAGGRKVIVQGNYIGTNPTADVAMPNTGDGLRIATPEATVGGTVSGAGNVISGNGGAGIHGFTADLVIQGNYIGVGRDGMTRIGNQRGIHVDNPSASKGPVVIDGVLVRGTAKGTLLQGNLIGSTGPGSLVSNQIGVAVTGAATDTTIGGSAAGAGNVISGNDSVGISVSGTPTATLIQGNDIGVMADDTPNDNSDAGITLLGGANTTVGGAGAGRNVISNNLVGIQVRGADVTGTVIAGNFIGTNRAGTQALGNGKAGVWVSDATGVAIGGTTDAARNVISGNGSASVTDGGQGILLERASDVAVLNNYIGLDVHGVVPLANLSHGVLLSDTFNVTVGGPGGQGNVIAGNRGDGIHVADDSDTTRILGNKIGVQDEGRTKEANGGHGVNVTDNASNTAIGGTGPQGAGNVISGNAGHGVNIDPNTSGTLLQGNSIGLNQDRSAAVANGLNGVNVLGGGVTVGGSTSGARNVIAGNAGSGVLVSGAPANGTLIEGNYIGTNGSVALPNAADGVRVVDASNVIIGGTTGEVGNVISGNGQSGIDVVRSGAAPLTGTAILRNWIGTDATGKAALGNTLSGVRLVGTTGAVVGEVSTGRNVISGNIQDGVSLVNAVATAIKGNAIGTTAGGNGALGNGKDGIDVGGTSDQTTVLGNMIAASAANGVEFGTDARNLSMLSNDLGPIVQGVAGNKVGLLLSGIGATIGRGNRITSSTTAGIQVDPTAGSIKIQGNQIGALTDTVASPNGADGIFVNGASGVTIGGTDAGVGNVISGNAHNGIRLTNVTATPSAPLLIAGNFIGTNTGTTARLANGQNGILLESSTGVQIASNVISGNGANGVLLNNKSNDNLIQANKIGTRAGGSGTLGNTGFGVFVQNSSSNNTIGGTASDGNVIAFNAKGVVIGNSLTDNSVRDRVLGNSIFGNAGLGIDLGNDGVTPNDFQDPDRGPNLLQNFPNLSRLEASGSDPRFKVTLNSVPNRTYRLEFFVSDEGDKSGFGQGQKFLTFRDVTTDANGDAAIDVALPGVAAGKLISATATDGNTSEFSAWVRVKSPAPSSRPPASPAPRVAAAPARREAVAAVRRILAAFSGFHGRRS
jgi:hypothetical protein